MSNPEISAASIPAEVGAAAREANLGAPEITLSKLRRIRRNLTTWIFNDGFIVRVGEGGPLDIYRWVACHVNYNITRRTDALGGTVYTEESVTVRDDKGAVFSVTGQGNPDVSLFLERAVDRITIAQLPRAWSGLREGRRLDFGRVQVDDRLVYYKRKSVPWSEVTSLEMRLGSVVIRRDGKRWRWVVPVPEIWDLHVLLRVAERMRRPGDPNAHRAPVTLPAAARPPAVPEQPAPAASRYSYDVKVQTVPEAVTALVRATNVAPLLTPAQVEDECSQLRKAWLGARLSAAPLEHVIGVIRKNLERDATLPGFMAFLVRLVDDQKCAQVTSLSLTSGGGGAYRIWRSEQGYSALGSAHNMITNGLTTATTPQSVLSQEVVTIPRFEQDDPSHVNDAEGRLARSAVDELVDLGRTEGFLAHDGRARHQAREIGRRLDEAGGMTLMRLVHGEVARQLPIHSRELDVAWDGIGSWLG